MTFEAQNLAFPWFARVLLLTFVWLCVPQHGKATHSRVASETSDNFRWIHPKSDPQQWERVLKVFGDELAPDEAKPGQSELDAYRYKYLQRVGVVGHSALVIVGHRPSEKLRREN